MRQLFLFLQQAAALTREPCSFFDKSTVACVDCKPFDLFLGVIAVTILYLTVVLSFAIDGRLDQFFMILVKGLERILSAPIDFVVIAVLSRCSSSRSNKVPSLVAKFYFVHAPLPPKLAPFVLQLLLFIIHLINFRCDFMQSF